MRIVVDQNVPVPMRDGVILQADLYRPVDGGRHPALIARTPYSKAAWPHTAPVDSFRLVRAGYALVVQDTRGRYASTGVFEPFVHERDDGADTVAWATQQPWCAGPVALFGGSYPGAARR